MTESAVHVRMVEESSAYWRVVFDYPPFNIVDARIFEALQDLLAGEISPKFPRSGELRISQGVDFSIHVSGASTA
jgi:hypothetical protein